ncbi:MAG TPA: type II secretion system protein GspM [Terriglobales bacterium]|nr:type II secretion system protein GspM [Terriglobales bacterium]
MSYDPRVVVSNYLARLAPRERVLIGVALGSLVLVLLYSFVWEGLQTGSQQIETRIAKREKELVRLQQQHDIYLDLRRRVEANQSAIAKRDADFNLFSHVQTTVAQAVSPERIASMNPSTKEINPQFQEERVEIKLTQMGLPQIVTLLHRIEKGESSLRFSRLQIKKRQADPYTFDVTATVSLLRAIEPGGAAS